MKLWVVSEMSADEIESGVAEGLYFRVFTNQEDAEEFAQMLDHASRVRANEIMELPDETPKYRVHLYETASVRLRETESSPDQRHRLLGE